MKFFLLFWSAAILSLSGYAQTTYPSATEADYVIRNFKFETNEVLPALSIHYTTIGHPQKG